MPDKLTVKQIRQLLGLYQAEMAEKLELSRHTYSLKELGKSEWTTTQAEKFCDVTGYKYDQVKF